MIQPKVSIVIPVYNGSKFMREAIDSALGQSYKNIEVIVVNDGSSDNGASRDIALSYGDKIRYFEKPNGGVATAFNLGIANMTGDYFSWLSHDDYYLPDKLKHQIELLDGLDPHTILYGDYILKYKDTGLEIPVRFRSRFTERQLNTSLFPVLRGIANACTMLIHKSHFDRVGLFDPALKSTQDYDMWFRMFRNTPILHCDYADVVMRQHPEQGSRLMPSHQAEEENLWIHMGKQIKEYEMAQIDGTPYEFYHTVYSMFESTDRTRIKEFYRERMQRETQLRKSEKTDDRDRLIDVLIENYTVQKQELEALRCRADSGCVPAASMSPWQKVMHSLRTDGLKTTLYKCYIYGIKKER